MAGVTVAEQRLDHLHKLGSRKLGSGLIRGNPTVVPEDRNGLGMVKNRKLARAIVDGCWRLLRMLLEAKARLHGGEVRIISPWAPTSPACWACGHRDGKKALSVRTWRCSACGAEHHRDVNAARNILATALAARFNACGAERKTSVLASVSEAGAHLNQGVQPWAT